MVLEGEIMMKLRPLEPNLLPAQHTAQPSNQVLKKKSTQDQEKK
jgi:hypothetical protein